MVPAGTTSAPAGDQIDHLFALRMEGRPVTMGAMQASAWSARIGRVLLVAIVATAGLYAVGPLAAPAPVRAGTAENMEAQLLSWINTARADRGVSPLSLGPNLVTYAGVRAKKMATENDLEHPSCLGCKLNKRGIPWSTCGETIAFTTYPWGTQAAQSVFNGWKHSPSHWNLLMSPDFERVGIGVAYRSKNHSTWASAVLAG